MSYIIKNALAVKFSSLFTAGHIQQHTLKAPSLNHSQGYWRQHSGHFRLPRPVPVYKHKPCLKSPGKWLETQAKSGSYCALPDTTIPLTVTINSDLPQIKQIVNHQANSGMGMMANHR
ncbi:hypothetical protein [Pseudomonas putida]|uniref:hypothetical protein n=1 Tax=Pseudomonas putida TaxID=303 RepID=UPI0024E0EF7A|nr:hypothetical protein [Pseudomonas putida]HDS0967418.1 hypothetical protein [Pseudomonas putida]HDS0993828.1 hypothetical protein [Pseudomonas putida]